MVTLKELTDVRMIRFRIDSLRKRMQMMLDAATSVSIQLSGMPRGGGKNDRLEQYCDDTRELSFRLLAEVNQYEKELERIEQDIVKLTRTEEIVIRLYYFEGMYWDAVSRKVNYSERSLYRIRDRALKKLQKM